MPSFNDLNESGRVERLSAGSRLFRFEYDNRFYGSCSFVARIGVNKSQFLEWEEESVCLEAHQLNRGQLPGLLNSARAFFTRMLRQYKDVSELDRAASTTRHSPYPTSVFSR
jgi:hypothetical protein